MRTTLAEFAELLEGPGRTELAIVAVVAVVLGGITALANAGSSLSYLLFPPLAAAAYRLFTRPDHLADGLPWDFPVGLTVGALSGWAAQVAVGSVDPSVPTGPLHADPRVVVLTVLFAGGTLYVLDIEIPPAFAVGLLLPFASAPPEAYVLNVAVASSVVAGLYVAWRRARDVSNPALGGRSGGE
ncbi:hypothetical protein [Halospeciosus flavus]|uniref:HPP family protein n=1 Tax=Halospeciosus flavus TaxID=3032283 RepID=A0ABD5Z6I3_9EURY|nr:hypothetical protein [Halospeciosus flavus]